MWPVYVGEFGGDLFVEVGPKSETEGVMDVRFQVVELLSTSPLPPLLPPPALPPLPLPI